MHSTERNKCSQRQCICIIKNHFELAGNKIDFKCLLWVSTVITNKKHIPFLQNPRQIILQAEELYSCDSYNGKARIQKHFFFFHFF